MFCQGILKGGSITVPLTSCLTSLESAVWQLTIFAFIWKKGLSKPVKQEVNGTVILPPLVFPVFAPGKFFEIVWYLSARQEPSRAERSLVLRLVCWRVGFDNKGWQNCFILMYEFDHTALLLKCDFNVLQTSFWDHFLEQKIELAAALCVNRCAALNATNSHFVVLL